MDMALAIHKINPESVYRLNHSQADGKQKIDAWGGPGERPTAQELEDAWKLCLLDRAGAALIEEERQQAIVRVKADTAMTDIVLVLRL